MPSKATPSTTPGLIVIEDASVRCFWQPDMPDYHDNEWGHPVIDDRRLFEKICLEGFHAGMSWRLIYNKRENFRRAFHDFDFHAVAHFGEQDIERLMTDKSIVRNRAKILSTINNAKRAVALFEETGSLAAWFWQFEPKVSERPQTVDLTYWQQNTTSAASITLSKILKKRGWTFVGPTTVYSFMQAMGMVNDHLEGCVCRKTVEDLRNRLVRPHLP
ncbi:DNA-3-methyladenine glycosylase I [Rouxiella sp. Mn2063]|uniref:DNA-3-methyladenine glycosylase I n=1 Tax=Rouxiella sp. Mn2063 TaxID=3395262 RepID=UPI003BD63D3F